MSEQILKKIDYEFLCEDTEPDAWRVFRLDFVERINDCYRMVLDLVSADTELDAQTLLGASATLVLRRADCEQHTSGILTQVDVLGLNADRQIIRVIIEPALKLLDQITRCKIFEDMSVAQIVDEVLGESLKPYQRKSEAMLGSRGQAVREYCVQYSESDLSFVKRLLQEEGINYYFDHEKDPSKETLVLFDESERLGPAKNIDGANIYPITPNDAHLADVESLRSLNLRSRLTSTTAVRSDWDWEDVAARNAKSEKLDARSRTRSLHFALARRYGEDDLDNRSKDHLEAEQFSGKLAHAASHAMTLRPGLKFEIEDHAVQASNGEYFVLGIHHFGECPEVVQSPGEKAIDTMYERYENQLEAFPADTPLRPSSKTPRPRIYGPQTARVCGPSGTYDATQEGEEIHTDEHGRIRLKFHWQLEASIGSPDSVSSCWARVSQGWAGSGWGAQFIPRVGMEVVVEFLDGNPDRPLVTGCVYNGNNAPPFGLPDEKTRSGIKTSSSIGGDGYNEISFEDQAGSEELRVHAQKDHNTTVLNDRSENIGNNSTITVGNDELHEVGNDLTQKVGSNKTVEIGADHTETVSANKSVTVSGNQDESVSGNRSESVGGDKSESISGSVSESVGRQKSICVGADLAETVGGSSVHATAGARSVNAGGSLSVASGDSTAMCAGSSFSISAGSSISIDAGASMSQSVADALSVTVGKDFSQSVSGAASLQVEKEIAIAGKEKLGLNVEKEISIVSGKAKATLKKNGDVVIEGKKFTIKASGAVSIKGSKIGLN